MPTSVLGTSMTSQPDKIQGASGESLARGKGSRPHHRAPQSLLFLPSYLCSVLFPLQGRGWVLKYICLNLDRLNPSQEQQAEGAEKDGVW